MFVKIGAFRINLKQVAYLEECPNGSLKVHFGAGLASLVLNEASKRELLEKLKKINDGVKVE